MSFRREKFVPFGGPDGGDGGNGGNVIVVSDESVTGLDEYRHRRRHRACSGEAGRGQRQHGKNGGDQWLRVPPGTVVSQLAPGSGAVLIADLAEPGQKVVVARGGRGGWGNARFATAINQTPRVAQRGEAGEATDILLELKLLADVGIIGYPNVGKSSLLAAASAARPEIASYPFTTREPVLGVVEVGLQKFVLAEIPGLIAGAHLGRGLGHEFLRHVARTRLLIHLVDGTSAAPVEDVKRVNDELRLYDSALADKPQLVVVNKIDLPEVRAAIPRIKGEFAATAVSVSFLSAATGEGVAELMAVVSKALEEEALPGVAAVAPVKVFRPQPRVSRVTVHKEGDTYVVTSARLERLFSPDSEEGPPGYWQLKPYLGRLGIEKALLKAGVRAGDRVRCGPLEWVWEEAA